jgi:hypothetical protein
MKRIQVCSNKGPGSLQKGLINKPSKGVFTILESVCGNSLAIPQAKTLKSVLTLIFETKNDI